MWKHQTKIHEQQTLQHVKKKQKKYYVLEDPDSDPNLSDSLLSNYDASDNSNYKRRRREKKKNYRKRKKQDPIKLCAKLTAKLLTTEYKLKVLKFKLDEDPLQRRIYFLTLIESLQIIISRYKENYTEIVDYPTIGGKDIKDHVKKAIRNILYVNINVHSKSLIA